MPETTTRFPCKHCGGTLTWSPGDEALVCPYCGTVNEVAAAPDAAVAELDYRAHLSAARQEVDLYEVMVIKCETCGSETSLPPNVTADQCGFCGTPYVRTAHAERLIKPQALLPFRMTGAEAQEAFKKWITSRWFAPNNLKKLARREGGLQGTYIPHWTYDAETTTDYTGQRGEYYYVTETRMVTENGKQVARQVQVRKTRWYHASGRVRNSFDDVLVVGSTTLPGKYLAALEPWDLDALMPYDDAYQSGFRTESYNVGLEPGFERAQALMAPTIDATIRRDIGGDEQQIHRRDTTYRDVTFKHLLLPVWISAYRYQEKVFRFLVNARTGEVQGERPYSWIKITLLVLFVALVLFILVMLNQQGA